MRKSSLWWAVRRLLKSWERIVHVAHPYSIASITSALNSLILSDSRAFHRSYNWELYLSNRFGTLQVMRDAADAEWDC